VPRRLCAGAHTKWISPKNNYPIIAGISMLCLLVKACTRRWLKILATHH
jgi:hypothetical protein